MEQHYKTTEEQENLLFKEVWDKTEEVCKILNGLPYHKCESILRNVLDKLPVKSTFSVK